MSSLFRRARTLLTGLSLCAATAALALPSFITFPPDVEWMTRESPHFQIIYRKDQDQLAAKALGYAEKAHRLLSPIFPKGPESTLIVLADWTDSTNGYALNFPYSHMVLFASPPDPISQLSALDDWLESLILHEYVHILHIYPANGLWKPMRTIFGTWVVPNGLMPTHFHEGTATFLETELTQGGRGRGTHFRAGRRMAVEAGAWNSESLPLDRMEGSTAIWPHGVTQYFYGYYLIEELWRRKGAKGIFRLTDSYSSNWPYFLNGPLQEVYGTDYATLWDDIFRISGESTKKEIERIKSEPLSPLIKVTRTLFHKWDVVISPEGKRFLYRKTDPKDGTALILAELPSGRVIDRIDLDAGGTDSICWGKAGNRELLLFPKTVTSDFYSTGHLAGHNLETGKSVSLDHGDNEKRLSRLHRIGCNRDLTRVLSYHELALTGRVMDLALDVALEKPRVTIKREWKIPQGSWVTSLLVDTDAWFALRVGLSTAIYHWPDGAKEPAKLVEYPAHIYNLRPGRRSGELLAIGTFDGRDEIWALDPKSKQLTKVIALLGGALSFDHRGGEYFLSSYEHGGYDIVKAQPIATAPARSAGKKPVKRKTLASSEADASITNPVPYSALPTLFPRTWVPSLLFVPDGAQIGVWIPAFDIAQKHYYNIFGGYDTRGLFFADIDYTYRFANGMNLSAGAYHSPSYIISDKSILKRWGGAVGLTGDLLPIPPSVGLRAVYRRVESFRDAPSHQSIGPEISVSYKTGFKRRPLDIAAIRGTALSLSHSQFFKDVGSTETYFSMIGGVEQNLHAPWADGHVWHFSLRGGFTEGASRRIYSYFEGGGELLLSQGRGYFTNRGFAPGTFFTRRILNLNAEYLFPVSRVDRGAGLMPFYLKGLHGALVSDFTSIGDGIAGSEFRSSDELFKVVYPSFGAELRSEWTFFFYIPAQLRVGLYHGIAPVGEALYGTIGVEAAL